MANEVENLNSGVEKICQNESNVKKNVTTLGKENVTNVAVRS